MFKARLEEYLDISTEGTGIPVSITIDDPSFDRDLYAVKPGFTCSIRFTADVGYWCRIAGQSSRSVLFSAKVTETTCMSG